MLWSDLEVNTKGLLASACYFIGIFLMILLMFQMEVVSLGAKVVLCSTIAPCKPAASRIFSSTLCLWRAVSFHEQDWVSVSGLATELKDYF